jgi:signal transduction histidine kinase
VPLPRKLKTGLHWKFTISISALVILTSISLGWVFGRYGVDLIKTGLMDRGRSLARNLAYNSEYGVLIGNEDVLKQLVEGVIREEDVLYAIIQNEAGEPLAEAQAAQLQERPSRTAPRHVLTMPWSDASTRAYEVDFGGETLYEIVYPIKTKQIKRDREDIVLALNPALSKGAGSETEKIIGLATVGMSLSLKQVNATIINIYQTIAILTGLVILAGIGVTVLLVRVIAGPIQQLALAAKGIAEGDLTSHVAVKSRDEIGDLAGSFNRMAESVRQREEELRGHADKLDLLNRELLAKQEELRAINGKLEDASRHKSEFLANMSHELRTPLNAIIGFSAILANESYGTLSREERQEFLNNIVASGRHLLGLINEVLDLSKIEANKLTLSPEALVIRDVLEDVRQTVKPTTNKKNISIDIALDPRLSVLTADAVKLKQILYNLIGNAVKFTPEGGRVDIRARAVEEGVEFSISDTGIGIRPEDQARIFQEFEQVETSAERRYEGTGLGLTLAKKLVELHSGRIWVESQVGKGSTFAFVLPLTADAPQRFDGGRAAKK